jgi:hypothetical protein
VTEAGAQFLNSDGSMNAAGYQPIISDDTTLLGIEEQLYGIYQQEDALVAAALKQWLGSQSTTQAAINKDTGKINANKRKIAANKVKEGLIRKALLDLQKPVPDAVQALEDQIKKLKLGAAPKILAAQRAKQLFSDRSISKEFSLEQAVINAQKNKLSYSALGEINRLKGAVIAAQTAEHAYTGTDTATKDSLTCR